MAHVALVVAVLTAPKLAPCPVCGKRPEIEYASRDGVRSFSYTCQVNPRNHSIRGPWTNWGSTERSAALAWGLMVRKIERRARERD